MDRRDALRTLGLGALGLLTACAPTPTPATSSTTGSSRTTTPAPTDPDLVAEGVERTSPSGEFTAAYESADSTFHPVIYDRSRQRVWCDSRTHTKRFGAGVMWQHDKDVLWILSRDLGHGHVEQQNGAWVYVSGTQGMPPEVSAHL